MSAKLADDELLITRVFDAPAQLIFSLWTEPAHFTKWMGPHGFECVSAEMDVRVGGAYRAMIRSAEHGDNWFGGTYREIEPGRRLVFTFQWESGPSGHVETLVTITFAEHGGKTTQTLHQTPFLSAERRDAHVGGWESSFDRLAIYTATAAQGEAQ
jgi:uncharacterized protein YndB with AHSA1/START domain